MLKKTKPSSTFYLFFRTSLAQTSTGVTTNENPQSNANTNNASGSSTVFTNFNHEVVGASVSVSAITGEQQLEEVINRSASPINGSTLPGPHSHSPVMQRLHSPHPAEVVMMNDVDLSHGVVSPSEDDKAVVETTNVCKVSFLLYITFISTYIFE